MQNNLSQASIELRLQRVISYLHTHLEEDLDLNKLAEIACMSPYHWHRVYLAVYGESVVATVKRLRLQGAATLLSHGDLPIEKIARQSGYPNVQSFTRIFAAAYGLPPARYRKEGSPLSQAVSTPARSEKMYPVAIKTYPEIELFGLEHQGSYLKINQTFDLIASSTSARSLFTADTRWIGVYFDDPHITTEKDLRSKACISVPAGTSLAAPFVQYKIDAGKYAVLTYQGPYADLEAVIQWLCGSWLPASGQEAANAPMFEEYLNDPRNTAPQELLTTLYLPLL
ncbi:AraC family transcriptional regulator [Janthinobacterium sp. B9-8]|uniref:AraC family transcriptional regulator n=1 Tax=Janthinobacterium sp. B9-8 TaxID=1236179 RepID=UPI00061D0BE8|nr:AraC family transcriptional regulator [Janthinobacterium sp. B9-8]AMC36833.1 AraC family transcriptional regulator [Janthinobacterium sp. B9-8]